MAVWNMDLAIKHLVENAASSPIGYCARYVRQAIEAGGVTLQRHVAAKDYGSSLIKVGFQKVAGTETTEVKGDVVVMQAIGTHVYGHMQMYSGTQWVSDYKQKGFWPYTHSRPEIQFYRFPGKHESRPSIPAPVDSGGSMPPTGSPGTGTPGAQPPAYPGKLLQWGSRGDDVVLVQRRLTQLGWSLTDDGIFGTYTRSAVRSFQQTRSLYVDGVVGPNTWKKLFS